ncbi:MAG: ACT domain-containing protein [Verrucomicrobia bacterium]|nr:ACT domain-containing protein [Verrucomicrobiota bacterium]
MVQLASQLALFIENKPGALARVCDAMSEAGINIHAFSTGDTVDYCVVRMVLSDPQRAIKLIEAHGCIVVETEVLLVEGDNKPGSMARIAHKLADADVNIDYAYCATAPEAKRGLLVIRTADPKKAMKVLNT